MTEEERRLHYNYITSELQQTRERMNWVKNNGRIVDGLAIDPVWIPKAAVNKDLTVKSWWVKLFKEGKTEWKKEEKKIVSNNTCFF